MPLRMKSMVLCRLTLDLLDVKNSALSNLTQGLEISIFFLIAEPGRPDMTGYFGSKDSTRTSGILKKSTMRSGDQSSRRGKSQDREKSPPRLEVILN